tara:strand:- start:578 stop:1102 length:525 start_codon:yes stop_codon:yes gene_type:complete
MKELLLLYDKLKEVLEGWLNPGGANENASEPSVSAETLSTKKEVQNSWISSAAPVKDDLPLFSGEKLLLLYDELLNEDLPDIVKLLKTLTTKFKHLPNEKRYFMDMYIGMLIKKKAIFPYTLAVSKYEIAMKICKKHNFTRGVIFFEFQIKYYKKYIKWKEKYNEDNNITMETW